MLVLIIFLINLWYSSSQMCCSMLRGGYWKQKLASTVRQQWAQIRFSDLYIIYSPLTPITNPLARYKEDSARIVFWMASTSHSFYTALKMLQTVSTTVIFRDILVQVPWNFFCWLLHQENWNLDHQSLPILALAYNVSRFSYNCCKIVWWCTL